MNITEIDAKEILMSEFHKAGINTGDTLLLHSSLKRLLTKFKQDFQFIPLPEYILDSLLMTLGNAGTLVLPLFNFDFTTNKFFDIRSTPSQMGLLTELGRRYPGAVRTGHPIYSFAAIGAQSDKFSKVYNYSGYGADSPFAIIKNLGGKIGVIGLDDQNSMTSYHYVEEAHNVDYRFHKKFTGEYIDWDGSSNNKEYGLFVRDVDRGVLTDVNRMGDLLWQTNLYRGSKHDQNFGIRTIKFEDFYQAVSEVINKNLAIDYLYSIKRN